MTRTVPFWLRALVFSMRFLPLPAWLKAGVTVLVMIIESLPEPERKEAKAELKAAAKSKDPEQVERVAKKICEGIGCGPNTKGI